MDNTIQIQINTGRGIFSIKNTATIDGEVQKEETYFILGTLSNLLIDFHGMDEDEDDYSNAACIFRSGKKTVMLTSDNWGNSQVFIDEESCGNMKQLLTALASAVI